MNAFAVAALLMLVGPAHSAASDDQPSSRALNPAGATGPLLTVTGMGMTPIVTTSFNTPQVVIDVVAGATVVFCWTADATSSYRYGFDIADIDDPDSWEMSWTPLTGGEACSSPLVFYFGAHTFALDVMDGVDNRTRVSIKMNIVTGPVPTESVTWGGVKAIYRE